MSYITASKNMVNTTPNDWFIGNGKYSNYLHINDLLFQIFE